MYIYVVQNRNYYFLWYYDKKWITLQLILLQK
jgi:hypothetical protein